MSGLEALGIAAAVVQVADTGLRLSQNIYKYIDSVKSADSRLAGFAQDVNRMAYIIRDVGDMFNEPAAKFVAPSGIQTARDCVGDCEDAFKEITAFVEHARKNKWKFPYREQKLKILDARLEKLKSNLTLILMVLSRSRDLKEAVGRKDHSHPRDDELLKAVASLKSASQLASTHYEKLHKSFEKLASIIADGQETTEELQETLRPDNAEHEISLKPKAEAIVQKQAARNEDNRFSSQNFKGVDLDEASKSSSSQSSPFYQSQVALQATSCSLGDNGSNVIPVSIYQDPNAAYVEGNDSPNTMKPATQIFNNISARVIMDARNFKPVPVSPAAPAGFRKLSDFGNDIYTTSKLSRSALSRTSIKTIGYHLNCIQQDLEELALHVQVLERTLESCSREMLTKLEASGLDVLLDTPTKGLERLRDMLTPRSSVNFEYRWEQDNRRFLSGRDVPSSEGRDLWSDQRRPAKIPRDIRAVNKWEDKSAATDGKNVVTVVEQDDQEYRPAYTVAGEAAAGAKLLDQSKTPERPAQGEGSEGAKQLDTENQLWNPNTAEKIMEEMQERLATFGFQENQIHAVLDPKKAEKLQAGHSPLPTASVPTYAKIHKNHIDVETLRYFSLPWKYDSDNNDYIVVLEEMSSGDTEVLFEHTRKLHQGDTHLLIEDRDRQQRETQYAFVRSWGSPPESYGWKTMFSGLPERDDETPGTKLSSEAPEETKPETPVSAVHDTDQLPTAVYDEVEGLLRDWTTVFD